jgi:hypothetical protein
MSDITDLLNVSSSDIKNFYTQNKTTFQAAGTVSDAFSQYLQGQGYQQHGQMQAAAAQFAAAQMRQNANSAAAMSERQAFDIGQKGQYLGSRIQALAAGQGGSASDPTVLNLQSRVAGETAYRQAAAIYGGQAKAREMTLAAQAEEWSGKEAAQMGEKAGMSATFASLNTLLKGGQSLFDAYGANMPA